VTVTGSGFTGTTDVFFGSTAAAFTVVSDTQLTATAPAHAVGTIDVTVRNAVGTSATSAADHYSLVDRILTVMNNLDSGVGSLRDTIAAAQDNDVIQFAQDLRGQTITLTSGELVLNKSLDIEGLGAQDLAISGGNASRVFDVTGSGVTVMLAGLTITGGRAALGGGLYDDGATVILSHSTLSHNQAIGSSGLNGSDGGPGMDGGNGGNGSLGAGGGIYVAGGTVDFDHSTLSDNQAIGGSGGSGGNGGDV